MLKYCIVGGEIDLAICSLKKVQNDEPIFVLRAQDRVAPATIRDWAQRAKNVGASHEKVDEAMDCALAMEQWAKTHGSKTPD